MHVRIIIQRPDSGMALQISEAIRRIIGGRNLTFGAGEVAWHSPIGTISTLVANIAGGITLTVIQTSP